MNRKILYCPWRSKYLSDKSCDGECVFCQILNDSDDDKNFLIKRFENSFIVLNIYPYNAGHILILPNKHKFKLSELSQDIRNEIMNLVSASIDIIESTLKTEGINVGLNLGKASGGSIPGHLHFHILPRWLGDTNFLTTLTDTKGISFDLYDIYQKLKMAFDKIQI